MRKIKLLLILIMTILPTSVYAAVTPPTVNARSAILMEASTGKVLYEQDADTPLPPASVTKVMTLLLIYDNVASGKIKWEDKVTISEHAASMGGSQIFLEPNEVQSVEVLTKSIAIASANDAAVAMAEYIGGSETGFVEMMNKRAAKLGMKTAHFENACGLDSDNHRLSARDIAIMSRELITKYPDIRKYTTTWQDTITHTTRKGTTEFGLTNTNKLIKWYNNATGLKTGSTSKALYCLSATAERDNMELIGVIMAAPDPKSRFSEAMSLLDYGFSAYKIKTCKAKGEVCTELPVSKGKSESVRLVTADKVNVLLSKDNEPQITETPQTVATLTAPIEAGAKVGEVVYTIDGKEIGRCDLVTEKAVEKAGFCDMLYRIYAVWL
jgi:D-alanyl-D-alanine carboxypeptidase (penicillin-binding protein 5/6)